MIHRVLVLCALCLLGACATQSPTVAPEERPAANAAYIYGRFSIATNTSSMGLTHINVGLLMECSDGARYTMLFKRSDSLYAIRVNPAECAFKEILFLNTGSYVHSTTPAPDTLSKPRAFAAGHSYYLGDFGATATYRESGTGPGILEQTHWQLNYLRDNFDQTSREFQTAFPALAGLPTQSAIGLTSHD